MWLVCQLWTWSNILMVLLIFPSVPTANHLILHLNSDPHLDKLPDKTGKLKLPCQPVVWGSKLKSYVHSRMNYYKDTWLLQHIPLNLWIPGCHHLHWPQLWQSVKQFHLLKVKVQMGSVLPWWPSCDIMQEPQHLEKNKIAATRSKVTGNDLSADCAKYKFLWHKNVSDLDCLLQDRVLA